MCYKNGKIIGYKLYKHKGGIDAEKFSTFYDNYIKNKYTKHLIILDNARFHKSQFVKDNIINSDNKIIYSLPYNPNLNPIENLFRQLKSDLDYIIKNKVSKEHLENYYNYLYKQTIL